METKTIDEAKLKAAFAGDANLRREFGDDSKSFIAFSKANADGRVRVCAAGSCGPVTAEQFHAEVQLEGLKDKLVANEAELKRLGSMQKSLAEDKASQYATGVPCSA